MDDSQSTKKPILHSHARSTSNVAPSSENDGLPLDSQDHMDMYRLGKKQLFKRNFTFWSALSFVMVFMGTWEFVLTVLSTGFYNGGFGGLFWCYITTTLCYASVVASLSEMASMAPTSGGQYHWVSEFAPPKYQKILSYASGWMSTLGWLATTTSGSFIVAGQVQSMIEVTNASFTFTNWQIFLLMDAFTLLTIIFNTYGAPFLPTVETACLIGHLLGFFVVLIPILILCPKNNASDVFLVFEDNSGWNNMGTAYLISQIYVLYCAGGSDSVVHIAEEVEDASRTVPRCMWWSYVGNITLGYGMLVAMLFCIGPLDELLDSDTAPYLILFNRTGSPALSIVLNVVLFLLIFAGNITTLAATSREVFAFARDKGLPFATFTSRISPKTQIPTNAVYIVSGLVILLSIIEIPSTLAFNIIVSVSLLGILTTYMISIGCILLKRLRHEPLPHARWSLGRWGLPINMFAFCYSTLMIVLCCFPTNLPVGLAEANWAPLVWVGVMIVSVVFYAFYGKSHYTPPVNFVEGKRPDDAHLQSSA